MASFRHTFVHKRSRREILERKDMLVVLAASYVSTAAFASSPRVDFDAAAESVHERRADLVRSAFPYIKIEEKKRDPSKYEDYEEYFDELDAIEAAKAAGSVGDDGSK